MNKLNCSHYFVHADLLLFFLNFFIFFLFFFIFILLL